MTRAISGAGWSDADRFSGPDRLLALDALRGFAIFLVIAHHASSRFTSNQGDIIAGFFRSVGWIGVDVFFALSGFLIVTILLRDAGRNDISGFFRRRFFRIVPIFSIAVVLYAIASAATGHEVEHLDHLWMTALFLNGWVIPFYGVDEIPFTITWSLSVEEFAYLLLGVSAFVSTTALKKIIIVLLGVAIAVRIVVVAVDFFEPALLYFFVPARLDAIAFGGLGAIGAYAGIIRHRYCPVLAGMATIGLMVAFQWVSVNGWMLPIFGYAAFGLVCAIWVTSLALSPEPPSGILVRLLAPLGKLSYFIYLFHMFFLDALRALQGAFPGLAIPYWPAVAIVTLACYFAAKVSWQYVEGPLIRFSRQRAARA